jgi:putative inorganic carbon (HCO3(-)) transporter
MEERTGFARASFLCLLALCLLPIAFYPLHSSPFLATKVLLLSFLVFLGVLFWALDCLLSRGGQPFWDAASLALLLFSAWALLRYPWSSGLSSNLRSPFLYPALALLFFLARQYGREEGRMRILIQVVLGVGGLVCVYGLLQFAGLDLSLYRLEGSAFGPIRPEGRWGRPFSTLGNPNFLGEFLAGLLPLALVFYLSAGRARRWLGGGLLLASLFLILVSGARAALLAALGGSAFFWWEGRRRFLWRRLGPLLVAVLVLVGAGMWVPGVRDSLYRSPKKLAAMGAVGEGSAGARLLWWRISLEMIKARPFLGTGTGTFREAYPDFQRQFFQKQRARVWIERVKAAWKDNYNATVEAPHNEYLQMAAEMGLPGLLLFLAFLFFLFRSPREGGSPLSVWQSGARAGCFSLLLASAFAFPLHRPSTGLLFFLLAALLGPQPQEVGEGEAEKREGGDALFGLLLVLIACLLLLQFIQQGRAFASGLHLYRGIGYHLAGKSGLALEEIGEAKALNPKDREIDYWAGLVHLRAGRLHSAREFLRVAQASFSSPHLLLLRAEIQADLKDREGAHTLYQEAIRTYPGLAPLHAGLGALYAREGRYAQALAELERAKEADPSYAETYHFLGHLHLRRGQIKEAQEAWDRFLALAPQGHPWRPLDQRLLNRLRSRPE